MPPKKTPYNRKRPTISFRVDASVNTVIRQKLKNYGWNIQMLFEKLAFEAAMKLREGIPPTELKVETEKPFEPTTAVSEKPYPLPTPTTLPHQEPHTCPKCGSTDLEPRPYGFFCKQCYHLIVLPAKPK